MVQEHLVAIHKNQYGEIISFQTSQGRIISYRKALAEAEEGTIKGVQIQSSPNGTISLSSETEQHFDQFPTIY